MPRLSRLTLIIAVLALVPVGPVRAADTTVITMDPIGEAGTLSFILHADRSYSNGGDAEPVAQTLLQLPVLGEAIFQGGYRSMFIAFYWTYDDANPGYYLALPTLPGPNDYALTFTWDAGRGLSDGYLNGIPFRTENPRYYQPWDVPTTADTVLIPTGPLTVRDVIITPKYTSPIEALAMVPKELRGQAGSVLKLQDLPEPIEVDPRIGEVLFEASLSNSDDLVDWVLEGPAKISFEDGAMVMRSGIPDPPDDETGHFNYWCPANVPESFVAEWEFKPLADYGVCHVFFAAKGENGEDLFDTTLPPRDGHYRPYHSGAIENYFLIYYSNRKMFRTTNMATSWLFKSHNLASLAMGEIAVRPGESRFHKLRLVKDGARTQLTVDGRTVLDFTDPGDERYGPVYGGGKIGFRQMARMVAAYRNFRVRALE